MSKFNALSKQAKRAGLLKEFTTSRCPVIYCYAPSGEGKTRLARDLINHKLDDGTRPYAPVLYLEADEGAETISEYVANEDLCTLISYDGKYGGKLEWFYKQLEAAEHAECGAIVIEGFTSLFKEMLSPKLRELTDLSAGLWTAHNEPAQHMDNVFEAVKKLKVNRRYHKTGVPIYVTLNVREISKDPGNANAGKMFVPDFSPNRIRSAMRTSDIFMELVRGPSGSMMLCQWDTHNHFRKLRRETVARTVEAAFDLSIPGLIYAWAMDSAKAKKKLSKDIQAEYEAAQQEQHAPTETSDS